MTQEETKEILECDEIRDTWEYVQEFVEKFGKIPEDQDELVVCVNYVLECMQDNYKEEIKEENETPMSEQEKTDFVSGKFLYAITDFSIFKRGETYWLEYIGDDTYCCRSDNHLNERIRIDPWELTRYFSEKPLHSLENILSEFAYHVRTWGLTSGESNMDFCNVEAHRFAKEMIKTKKYDTKR